MLQYLASICNDIQFNADANISAQCQGFVYEAKQKIAFFKPQPAARMLNTNDLCSNPTTYTWLLTKPRGWLHCIHTCTGLPPYRSFAVGDGWNRQRGIYIACVLTSPAVHPASITGTANMAHAGDGFEEHHGFVCRCMPAAFGRLFSNAHAFALCVYAGVAGAIPPTTSSSKSSGLGRPTCHCCMLRCFKYALGPNTSCCESDYQSKASGSTCRVSTFQQRPVLWHSLYKLAYS